MDPRLGVARLERVGRVLVEAVLAVAALAGKVQLGVLLALPLLDRALDRQGQLDRQRGHVRLDLVQVLLAKVLHRVAHRVGLEDRDALYRGEKC